MKIGNILSLFDGISCGQLALQRADIEYDNYYASEIDKSAISVTQFNFPKTIQLGDIKDIKGEDLPKIDLLLGGSPCQGFSNAGGGRLNFNDPRSKLFFDYVRLLKELKPKWFLLENVKMKKEWQDIITDYLGGVEPIEIDSVLLSAQRRTRLYWTNISGVRQPEDKKIKIKDIIYDDSYKNFTDKRITNTKKITKNYIKWDLSGKRYWSQQDRAYFKEGIMCTIPRSKPATKLNIVIDFKKDIYRRMHPIEVERCQTINDDYTKVDNITYNTRLELIGNAWTVDVIVHILKNIFCENRGTRLVQQVFDFEFLGETGDEKV